MDAADSVFSEIVRVLESGSSAVLVTVVGTQGSSPGSLGNRMLVFPDGSLRGTVGGGAVEYRIIQEILGQPLSEPVRRRYSLGSDADSPSAIGTGMICGGTMEVLLEPLGASHRLVIVGGGHCAIALTGMARQSGFHVTILDNREDWADAARHPGAQVCRRVDYGQITTEMPTGPNVYVVIMTHGHVHDREVLAQCLGLDLRYLGMIGSRRKVTEIFAALRAQGCDEARLAQVFAPIGLAIGSHTPAEVAVSICAQLIAVRYGCEAVRLSENPLRG